MIVYLLLQVLNLFLNAVFYFIPKISALPTILGVDLDATLSTGIGYINSVAADIWPIRDVMAGLVVLLTYYALKLFVQFLLGHRAPH